MFLTLFFLLIAGLMGYGCYRFVQAALILNNWYLWALAGLLGLGALAIVEMLFKNPKK